MNIIHFGLAIILTLIVVGLLLWAVNEMPWIDTGVKKLVRIVVILFAVLWLISLLFNVGVGNLTL